MTTSHFWPRNILWLSALLLAPCVLGRSAGQSEISAKQTSGEAPEAHLGKGYEALKEERYEEAVREFRAALEIDPKLVLRARFPLAVALFEQHKAPEARKELEAVRREVGDHPNVSYYLGRLDLEDRDFESAIRNLNAAIADPPFPDTPYYLGFAYLKRGDAQAAEKWLKEAERLNPHDSRVPYQLAILYRKVGRVEEAQQAFVRSQEQHERDDKESQLRGECIQYLDQDVREQSSVVCEQLYDPNDAEKLTALGILYGQHGHPEKALKPLRRAAELAPQSPQMQYNLALTYFQLSQFADARVPLAEAVKRWPDLFTLNALYGAVLWKLGETLPAYQALGRAHQLNAEDPRTADLLYLATVALAEKSEESAQDSDALRYLEEAAKLRPNKPEPHKRMALIYTRTGRPGQARDEQRQADRLTNPR